MAPVRFRLVVEADIVANYVKQNNAFRQDAAIARECPHCGANAQLIPVSTPSYKALVSARPSQVALGFSCSACGEPRFGKARVRAYEPERVVLSSKIVEVERARERFQLAYLPEQARPLFEEALACYTADLHNAFASLCRRTADASIRQIGHAGLTSWRNAFASALELGEIDTAPAEIMRAVLFGDLETMPTIDAEIAAVLIEVMKDVLYQIHVRRAKFKAAMQMRRYFAEEGRVNKVTSFRSKRGQARSA